MFNHLRTLLLSILLATSLVPAAGAEVVCELKTSTPEAPNNYTRKIFSTTVVENPSSNPMDRSRSRYIVVASDYSARALDSAHVDQKNKISDESVQVGETIVWVQELIGKRGLYAAAVSTITGQRSITPDWEGSAWGGVNAEHGLTLILPKKRLSVSCDLER